MLASHINIGQTVEVKTKGGDPPFRAPKLTFVGRFKDEVIINNKTAYINLNYDGDVVVLDESGKVIGYEKGEKVLSIPRGNVESVEVCRRKK